MSGACQSRRLPLLLKAVHSVKVPASSRTAARVDTKRSRAVQAMPLRYATYQIGGGLHGVAALGGPIRAGERVRVWHLGPTIVNLQIAQPD